MQRRDFLKGAAASAGGAAFAQTASQGHVSLVLDPHEPLAAAPSVRWAAGELEAALATRAIGLSRFDAMERAPLRDLAIRLTGRGAPPAAESLALSQTTEAGRKVIVAAGGDARGLMYAVLELADRVRYAEQPLAALEIKRPIAERPANRIRAISRLFTSDVEDKPWFNDRSMWPAYFSMLASQRFNRFHLAFGIGYDFLREVTDAYFLFFYPFVVDVPGYKVRAKGLPDAERDRNLEMLKYIAGQAAAHGLEFQLGVWMHGYQWANSPRANYTIEGLNGENHGPYCRDALAMVLRACPEITGVTLRVHGESGVPEGSYDFWKTVFDGVARSGRAMEIDLHPKGVDQKMIEAGLATGMPLALSPKFWAEHMGMPYHQADIRPQEIPREGHTGQGLMALSSGSRSFTRYGYADLLREDRRYAIVHRIWPGTHRLLLWGDPAGNAAYSRAFGFCGSDGVDLMEPLSFMGRRGSGTAGDRCAYADPALSTRWDWQKFLCTYRAWGRMMYDPGDFDGARRGLSPSVEAALSSASRILPLITTAHCPSAANNNYWPEIYTNQPIVNAPPKGLYSDTPEPRVFGNTSPLDPQLFLTVNAFADELLKGQRSGKYSPIEVAQWLEGLADAVLSPHSVVVIGPGMETRRGDIDTRLQANIGSFFAAKLRAGVLYAIYDRTRDRAALEAAVTAYRKARSQWALLAHFEKPVYVADIAAGELAWLRGNWADRLPAIDQDVADMAKLLDSAPAGESSDRTRYAIRQALGQPQRPALACRHTPPPGFRPGQPLEIFLGLDAAAPVSSVRIHYRHVNQGERFQTAEMRQNRAVIPSEYTDSPYPLQYYFELRQSPDSVALCPGFAPDLANQPYFVVRRNL